ncbi:hypothetical protein GOP47_0020700 [Adiantum capillus-veneris]|uniref:C2 domain-containing protein n=1 Tax=Adiantum capillus-veneris TaxID=13818 RepID=A0A9D4Z7P8_ADICA|nr:hypothetical protein GOP47_0020700 [Adiantum capillus-veneris]
MQTQHSRRDSSGRTFDLNAIASGSNGAHVTNRERACRLSVIINAVRDLKRKKLSSSPKEPLFKLTVGGQSRQTSEIKGKADEYGVIIVNESFTFDVKDAKSSVLSVQVFGKGLLGAECFGQCKDIVIADLLNKPQGGLCNLKAQWYELYSKDGKRVFPGKVLMQIAAGVAKPEQVLRVFVGTWNVGDTRPADNLTSWLPTNSNYDIVSIGTQECDYQARAPHTECSRDWMATLRSFLGHHYKVVHGISRGKMRLAVFARIDGEKAISDICSGSEATGVGNVMPNKGGLCIALKFWDTSLCFINCHLSAHVGQCEARNGNYRDIVGNIRINDLNIDILNQFHHVFWFGDLNYRLDFGADEEALITPETAAWDAVAQKIQQDDFHSLLQYDELHKEKAAKRVLFSFKEGEINFAPTFKMRRDTEDAYDMKRVPAWCDRILWSSLPGCTMEQLSYTSSPSVSSSDHKPVAATFSLKAYALPCNCLDNLDEEDKRWHVRFTVLRARNLRASDVCGYSDPYVSFLGPNLFEEVRTAVRLQNLNPVWNPLKDLPTIVLNTFAIERLEKEYLMVRVVDYNKKSTDDTLGYGVIPLAGAVTAFRCKGTADFVVELSHRGCPAGTLEGTLKLTWERNVAKRRFKLANGFSGRSGSMKHQLKRRVFSSRLFQ